MSTYKKINDYITNQLGHRAVKTCWIADIKRKHGLTTRQAHNRISTNSVTNPCPSDKVADIESALKYFKMI